MIKELGSRIYYEKTTGNVIFTRGDMSGFVEESSIDDDFEMYNELQQYNKTAVGVIELPYGGLNNLLEQNKANTYKVDVSSESHKLAFSWIDPVTYEPGPPPKTLEEIISEKVNEAKLENALAITELIEKVEKDKLELATAVIEAIEMQNSGGTV